MPNLSSLGITAGNLSMLTVILGKVGLAAARHMPAPVAASVYYRWFFDTVQDLCNNNDRVGQVR